MRAKMMSTASVIDVTSAEFKKWKYSSNVMVHSSTELLGTLYALKPFIANAVVAMWQLHCYAAM